MSTDNTYTFPQEGAGNPGLYQVQDFVEEAAAAPSNPLGVVERAFRGIWIASLLGAALVGMLLAYGGYNVKAPVFESEGLVRVVAKEAKILYADSDDSRLRLYDAFVSAEVTYLSSQPVLERAYDILVDKMLSGQADVEPPAYKDFAESIAVKKLKGLISLTAENTNPAAAQRTVNALLNSYVELHTELSGTRKSLRARELEVRQQELLEKQFLLGQQLLEVGEEYDASSLAKAHLTKVTQLEELDIRIDELANSLLEMESSDGALDADTGDMEIKRATLLDRAMADMVFERAKRAAELKKLMFRYQPSHPKVQTLAASMQVIDEAIESRRRLIATLGKTGAITGGDGSDQSQSIAELEALTRKLTSRRNDLSLDAKELNGKLIQLRRISEEKAQIAGMLAETRRILDQVNLENRTNLPGTIEILSRGSLPEQASKDKRAQFALLALMAGGGLVVCGIFFVRRISDKIRYSDDFDGIGPQGVKCTAFPTAVEPQQLENFLGDLQMSDRWDQDRATVVTFVRFGADTNIPMSGLAEIAAEQGLKTLLVCAAEDGSVGHTGFTESLNAKLDVTPVRCGHYDFLPFGRVSAPSNYSVEKASDWFREWTSRYDLILLYAGVTERHFSTRILPKLSHISVPVIRPGDSQRQIRRTTSLLTNMQPLFVDAPDNDPGVITRSYTQPKLKGASHEQAA